VGVGETLTLSYHGDELLPDPPAPGSYRIRFVGGQVESPWVDLQVA
jgi:hypothetical protein